MEDKTVDSARADKLAAHQKSTPNCQHKSPVLLSQFPLKYGLTDTARLASKFEEGQDVLARWSDGLFYQGTISKEYTLYSPVLAEGKNWERIHLLDHKNTLCTHQCLLREKTGRGFTFWTTSCRCCHLIFNQSV
ncbi:uncharacterized protein LOC128026422 isoform X2 [Carassius gibelio]|uniref:uncharacterized protein LOC128026422 isoform X2 n=1 Tax=Carassius gibelio TaxID=101364 RepID=UPI002278ED04|nr:uncharacterized protein LOC128026422 isoform X2 [Carassius gibelio]